MRDEGGRGKVAGMRRRPLHALIGFLLAVLALPALGAAVEPAWSLARKEKAPLLDTLKELVSIESGSADREGLDRIAEVIARRLKALGAQVEMIEPGPDAVRF